MSEYVFPHSEKYRDKNNYEIFEEFHGLTKRELFAAMAMQGIINNPHRIAGLTYEDTVTDAVNYADALIAELEKKDG